MPWFRVDDSLDTHPKAIAAGNEALGLWVRCGAYAARHLTDGFIPEEIAQLYGAAKAGPHRNSRTGKPELLAETLVRAKLWRRMRGGWQMHDYLGYNPTRTTVEAQRKTNAERQNRWREARSRRPRNAVTNAVTNAAPSHPIPKDPLTPAPPGAGEHAGQHPNCRACGTNPRGEPPPTPTPPRYQAPNGQPLRGQAVTAIAAQARQAITKPATEEEPDVPQ